MGQNSSRTAKAGENLNQLAHNEDHQDENFDSQLDHLWMKLSKGEEKISKLVLWCPVLTYRKAAAHAIKDLCKEYGVDFHKRETVGDMC